MGKMHLGVIVPVIVILIATFCASSVGAQPKALPVALALPSGFRMISGNKNVVTAPSASEPAFILYHGKIGADLYTSLTVYFSSATCQNPIDNWLRNTDPENKHDYNGIFETQYKSGTIYLCEGKPTHINMDGGYKIPGETLIAKFEQLRRMRYIDMIIALPNYNERYEDIPLFEYQKAKVYEVNSQEDYAGLVNSIHNAKLTSNSFASNGPNGSFSNLNSKKILSSVIRSFVRTQRVYPAYSIGLVKINNDIITANFGDHTETYKFEISNSICSSITRVKMKCNYEIRGNFSATFFGNDIESSSSPWLKRSDIFSITKENLYSLELDKFLQYVGAKRAERSNAIDDDEYERKQRAIKEQQRLSQDLIADYWQTMQKP